MKRNENLARGKKNHSESRSSERHVEKETKPKEKGSICCTSTLHLISCKFQSYVYPVSAYKSDKKPPIFPNRVPHVYTYLLIMPNIDK